MQDDQPIEAEAAEVPATEPPAQEVEQGPVTPIEPVQNKVQVQCGGCKRNFELDLPEPNIVGFEFDCTACGAHNEVQL